MPLPAGNTVWPPKSWQPFQRDIDEAAVWYANDVDALNRFYLAQRGGDERPSRRRFWGRRDQLATGAPNPRKVHVPACSDIAATSADLLFGEPPIITIPEAHEKATTDQAGATNTSTGNTGAKATETRMHEIFDLIGLANTLLEGAEVGSALGGVYLRPVWDTTVADHPLLTVVHADRAVPEFSYGVLKAVTFWTCLVDENSIVVRHLERHEAGVILHGLYVGDKDRLGAKVALKDHPSTAGLEDQVIVPAGITGLDVSYVPNVLPNRKRRHQPVGRADTQGAETLMDALDATFTSWMRDIDLGQARIVVPEDWLTRAGRGEGATFDIDRQVFTGLPGVDPAAQQAATITPVEFKIRTDEHAATAVSLWERIVSSGGYSTQTFGLQGDGGDATATEIRAREGKSLRTRARKERYWAPAIADQVVNLLIIDNEVFGKRNEVFRPRIDFQDGIADDPKNVAETVQMLKNAQAASVRTRVLMVQPELEGAELEGEVQAILNEEALAVPEPTGGFPA